VGPVPVIAALVLAAAALAGPAEEPHKKMFDDTLVFTGTETLAPEAGGDEIIIGLFSPDDADHPVGRDIARGAILAVDQANAAGGIDERMIRIVRRWADDPWGAGANEVARLVFDDRAWAIIGGPDGGSTHIAQQVATKAHIPLVAPVSSDPTLTQTRVPWIFRIAPNDEIQAHVLADAAVNDRSHKRIGLITGTDHDSRTAAGELAAALQTRGMVPAFHFEYSSTNDDLVTIAQRAAAFEPDGLMIRTPRDVVRPLIEALGSQGFEIDLFLPWIPGALSGGFPTSYPGGIVRLQPFDLPRSCGATLKLERAFIARYGERLTPAAAYGYDAARLVIDGLMAGAIGRVELRDRIAEMTEFTGAAGPIIWDRGGGNTAAQPVLISR